MQVACPFLPDPLPTAAYLHPEPWELGNFSHGSQNLCPSFDINSVARTMIYIYHDVEATVDQLAIWTGAEFLGEYFPEVSLRNPILHP